MSRGVNRVILLGNLGNDPEIRYTQGGTCICTLSIATTYSRKDKDGQQQEKTEWHRVKLFGKLGEIAGEYLKKGRQVYIEGRIEYGSYEKDGVKHYTTDVIGEDMQMIGGASDAGERPQRGNGTGRNNAPMPQRREPAPARFDDAGGDPFGDNIPFATNRGTF